MKYHKKLNCYSYELFVDFKGISVKIIFCRIGKRRKWHGLLTTNTKLYFATAYEIYATRWTIEVFFKECKQYLRLGKCESRDFNAQIATTFILQFFRNYFYNINFLHLIFCFSN
ncbi:MAG: transposase [Bacteroidales bacterium]|jgi:IS4 transposase|nr:transposase [Bacteroidales bacterium]